jgi:hypothetical protein
MESDSQPMERSGEETTEPNEEHAEPVGAPTEQHAIEQQAPVAAAQLSKKRKRSTKIGRVDEVAEDKAEVQETKKEPVKPILDDSRKRDVKVAGKKSIGCSRLKVQDKFSKQYCP